MWDVIVGGMTCTHCVRAVSEAVTGLPGVLGVAVELETGHLRISGDPDMAAVKTAIEEEGYQVLEARRS